MIGIEHENEFLLGPFQRLVNLAGLGPRNADQLERHRPQLFGEQGEAWIAGVVEQVRRVRISNVARCGQRAHEHLIRLAGSGGRKDRHSETPGGGDRLRLLEVKGVVPADDQSKDAVPRRQR